MRTINQHECTHGALEDNLKRPSRMSAWKDCNAVRRQTVGGNCQLPSASDLSSIPHQKPCICCTPIRFCTSKLVCPRAHSSVGSWLSSWAARCGLGNATRTSQTGSMNIIGPTWTIAPTVAAPDLRCSPCRTRPVGGTERGGGGEAAQVAVMQPRRADGKAS